MSIFEYEDYRQFIMDSFEALPEGKHGQFQKLAKKLNVHPTLVSQVFKKQKDFSLEQASLVCEYLKLTDIETDFFLLLVQMERAGNPSLRKNLKRQIKKCQDEASKISSRLANKRIGIKHQAKFYSHWYYSAVRLLSDFEAIHSREDYCQYLGLSPNTVQEVIDFLMQVGLIKEDGERYKLGTFMTHTPHDSPFVYSHHRNWRIKAMENYSKMNHEKDMAYTSPFALSYHEFDRLRDEMMELIKAANKRIKESKSETLACLNVDWFEVKK